MKLVAQDDFPAFVKRRGRVRRPIAFQHAPEGAQPFRFPVQQLQLAVHPLVVGLARIRAPVIFEM
ncbi:hypothetical protein D1872_331120 [compost metagenome]